MLEAPARIVGYNRARLRSRFRWLILFEVLLLNLGLAIQLDSGWHQGTTWPDPFILAVGAVVGLVVGWIVQLILVKRLAGGAFRLVSPVWLGMIAFGVLAGGLFFALKVVYPMDWRPVVAVALLGTLPGCLIGGIFSRRVSRDLIEAEPVALDNPALLTLNENLRAVEIEYPGASGKIFLGDTRNYLAQVRVPRTNEDLLFYIACDEDYPRKPPVAVAVELALPDGRTHNLQYDAPIIYYWSNKYGLRHIIQEALQILNH